MKATLGQGQRELDVNYLILSVITNSRELRYNRLKAFWSFTWSAACSFLFISLFIVENQRLQMIITGHLHITFSSYPSACWWFCLCCVTNTVLGNQLGWEAAVCEESVDKTRNTQSKGRTVGEDFQRELQKRVCYEHSVVRSLHRKRRDGYQEDIHSQSLAPLLALKTLHVKLSLLQVRLLLCIGTSGLFTGEENAFWKLVSK